MKDRRQFLASCASILPAASIVSTAIKNKENNKDEAIVLCTNTGCAFNNPCDFHIQYGFELHDVIDRETQLPASSIENLVWRWR